MEKNETLALVKGWYEAALLHPAVQAWREEARLAWDFYDGSQWAPEEVAKLAELGQPAIVINKIAAKIDNIAGTEVAGRTRLVFRSRSGNAREEQAAQVLSDLMTYVAERAELPHEVSQVFRAGLVSGIGWLDVGVAEGAAGPEIFIRAEDEMSVVWDPLACAADLSDARFIARERWLDEAGVRQVFPEQAAAVLAALRQTGLPLRLGGWQQGGQEVAYHDERRGLFRIVEVQHKATVKHWQVQHLNGRITSHSNRAEARKEAAGSIGAQLMGVVWVPQVKVTYFAGETLLASHVLEEANGSFTLLPYVYKRHKADGRPYGLVRGAIDPQRELNKRRSKAMHLLNTAQVIADIDAVEDPAVLAREAARPDGLILKRAGKDLRIIRNADLASSQVAVMEQAGRDIQDVLGVFDDNMGKPTQAISGAAIQQRQLAGTLNQMFAFDALRRLKKALGGQLLALMRQTMTPTQVLRITDNLSAARLAQVGLNNADWASMFDVVVEEVGEVVSARELAILQTQRPDLIGA
jgi:hypothetical protein